MAAQGVGIILRCVIGIRVQLRTAGNLSHYAENRDLGCSFGKSLLRGCEILALQIFSGAPCKWQLLPPSPTAL